MTYWDETIGASVEPPLRTSAAGSGAGPSHIHPSASPSSSRCLYPSYISRLVITFYTLLTYTHLGGWRTGWAETTAEGPTYTRQDPPGPRPELKLSRALTAGLLAGGRGGGCGSRGGGHRRGRPGWQSLGLRVAPAAAPCAMSVAYAAAAAAAVAGWSQVLASAVPRIEDEQAFWRSDFAALW